MSQNIRIGNDIRVDWTLKDADEQPYNLRGRNIAVEVVIGAKKYRVTQLTLVADNTIRFTYWGKDQKWTGSCDLKFIENDGMSEMVTFDTQDAFTLVPHSWQALDEGETPETIQIEVVTITSELDSRVGPQGPSGEVGAVTATIDGDNTQPPAVDVTTSGPDTKKDIAFHFHNIQGPEGPQGPTGGVYWPTLYVDSDLHLHVVEPALSLGERLYIRDGYMYAIN